MKLLSTNPTLGKGELESIAVCINRLAIFATLDEKALQFAKAKGIHVLHIHTILKMLLKAAICSKSDIISIVKKIERTDKRIIELSLIFAQP